jgi:GMP synthase-like glutamine amidotransferase
MSILFVQHIDNEGPGHFKKVLDEQEVPFQVLKTSSSVKFDLPSGCLGVIILGGPMNADDESDYPFLAEEKVFIRELIKKEVPLLGICLGAQLIVQAAGGEVFKASEKEIGWYETTLSREGERDFLFRGLPKSFHVFQWHEDTFSISPGGKLLVTAAGCTNKGFKLGKRCYGIQFHLETEAGMIDGWLQAARRDLPSNHIGIIQKETEQKEPECLMWGKRLLLNFLDLGKQYLSETV